MRPSTGKIVAIVLLFVALASQKPFMAFAENKRVAFLRDFAPEDSALRERDLEPQKLIRFAEKFGHRVVSLKTFIAAKWGAEKMSEPSKEELLARIAELEKQAGTRKKGSLEFRVGEKGGVSVYGLGRFPVTLYYEQWIRLLDIANELREFLETNKSKLKLKTTE